MTVAATKCLTECGDVYGTRPLWEQLRAALDEKLKGGCCGCVLLALILSGLTVLHSSNLSVGGQRRPDAGTPCLHRHRVLSPSTFECPSASVCSFLIVYCVFFVAFGCCAAQALAPRAAVRTTARRTSWTQQTRRAATAQRTPSWPTPACRSGQCSRRSLTPSSLQRPGWPALSAGWAPADRLCAGVCGRLGLAAGFAVVC